MTHKYTITICGSEEGLFNQTECDAYIVLGLKKGEKDGPKFASVHTRMNNVELSDMVNALYSNKQLRAAAIIVAHVHKRENTLIRRIGRWLRGEDDEQEA